MEQTTNFNQQCFLESSLLSSAAYSATDRRLQLQYKNGTIYVYEDVPQTIYDGLISAESAGKYFNMHIKGKYANQKAQ